MIETISIIIWSVIFSCASFLLYEKYIWNPLVDVLKMGHMKTWWIFGFEWWGLTQPYRMMKNGIVYRPLFCGLWIATKDKSLK